MTSIKVNCSNVAALIGKHRFKSREEAIEEVLVDNALCDTVIDYDAIAALELIQESSSYVDACMNTKSESEFKEAVSAYKANIIKTAEEKGICKDSPIVTTAIQELNLKVGTHDETKCIDAYETDKGVDVTHRNTKCYIYKIPNVSFNAVLAGRVDGLTTYKGEVAVLENKKRMKSNRYPTPEYDIIQLRCYMKLTSSKYGILNESYPDGTSRQTHIEWDNAIWSTIVSSITDVLSDIWVKYC